MPTIVSSVFEQYIGSFRHWHATLITNILTFFFLRRRNVTLYITRVISMSDRLSFLHFFRFHPASKKKTTRRPVGFVHHIRVRSTSQARRNDLLVWISNKTEGPVEMKCPRTLDTRINSKTQVLIQTECPTIPIFQRRECQVVIEWPRSGISNDFEYRNSQTDALTNPFQMCAPSSSSCTTFSSPPFFGTYSEHVLCTRAASAFDVIPRQLVSKTSAASVFGKDSEPITHFKPKK